MSTKMEQVMMFAVYPTEDQDNPVIEIRQQLLNAEGEVEFDNTIVIEYNYFDYFLESLKVLPSHPDFFTKLQRPVKELSQYGNG
jgi:hypothetical protein